MCMHCMVGLWKQESVRQLTKLHESDFDSEDDPFADIDEWQLEHLNNYLVPMQVCVPALFKQALIFQ